MTDKYAIERRVAIAMVWTLPATLLLHIYWPQSWLLPLAAAQFCLHWIIVISVGLRMASEEMNGKR